MRGCFWMIVLLVIGLALVITAWDALGHYVGP